MTDENQKTGVIYARVSSWEQVSNTSLERQVRECQGYADRNGIKVLSVFVEEGESAKTVDRTEFQKALAYCSKTKPTYFIVYKVDRFSRNQDDHVLTKALLRKYGTEIRSATEPIDESSIGRLQLGILSVFSEFDNNVRAERSRSGMVENVRKGIWQSQAPIGYKRLTKGGNLVVEEPFASSIKQIFEEYSKGVLTFQALSDFMNERGFRTRVGKKACAQLMEKIVHNPVYCGIIRAFGEENRGAFPALISEELFWKCQEGYRVSHSGKRSVKNPLFPLRKITTCSHCGTSLTGSCSTGRKGIKYPYYHHHKQGCNAASFISKETLEQNFVEFLQSISPNPKYEKLFKAIVLDVWQSNYKKLDGENTRIRKEIEGYESERQRIFDFHRSGKYSDDEFLDQKDKINLLIQQKKRLLEDKRVEEFSMETALDYCFRFVRESAKTWMSLSEHPTYRERFQKSIFPENLTFDGKKFGTSKMALVYEMNQQSDANSSQLVTLTTQNSKPIIEFLQTLSAVAGKFASLQNYGLTPTAQLQEILP